MAMNKLAELIGAILVVMTFVKMRLIATPHTESDDHDSSLLSHMLCAAWEIAGEAAHHSLEYIDQARDSKEWD